MSLCEYYVKGKSNVMKRVIFGFMVLVQLEGYIVMAGATETFRI